jgi:hypothetical protein
VDVPWPSRLWLHARVASGKHRPISRLVALRAALWRRFQRFDTSYDHAVSASSSTWHP